MIPHTFFDEMRIDAAVRVAMVSEESAAALIRRFSIPHRKSGDLLFVAPVELIRARKLERARRKEVRR